MLLDLSSVVYYIDEIQAESSVQKKAYNFHI